MSSATAAEVSIETTGRPRGVLRKLLRRPRFVISATALSLLVLMAVAPAPFAGIFGHGDPRACDLARSGSGAAPGHPFGFDIQGCDLYAQVVYGARPSITIGIAVTLISVLVAVAVGSIAGYYGGVVDSVLGRVIDVFYGFPFIVAAIVILTAVGVRNIWTVCAALAAFSWPTMTRVMRSSVIVAKNAEYVRAARALGASDLRILRRHILPNAFAPVLVLASLSVAGIIAGEASLTFLGVGLQPPTISWGVQLNTAQSYFNSASHLLLYPSIFLSVTVLAFVLLGDAVRDAVDPKAH
ncbi:ABC transporter permease [Ornithinimicrobium cavernae]|uniref:ABC transporter permease n=1 Tax=Ornithinimicrobium cavernae TaxID=2666047 RepID=UPI000D696925|nr:ABC transporter permease [Ornithinimicrobium cavernae]